MDRLSQIPYCIGALEEEIPRTAASRLAPLRELMAALRELRSAVESSITGSWQEGYKRGWEDSAAGREREQVLATVTDLASRLLKHG